MDRQSYYVIAVAAMIITKYVHTQVTIGSTETSLFGILLDLKKEQ